MSAVTDVFASKIRLGAAIFAEEPGDVILMKEK